MRGRQAPPPLLPASLNLTPAGYIEDDAMAGDIVLNADVIVSSEFIEETASGFSMQIIQVDDANAAVTQCVDILAVFQAHPDAVVKRIARFTHPH